MKRFKSLILFLAFVVFFVQLYVVFQKKEKEIISQKPWIAVSTFSLYDIVKHIGDDNVVVVNILPFGVDPHSFEPTPKLMAEIERSDLVLYSGAGLEPWTHGFAFKNRAIEVSEHVSLRELGSDAHESEHHDHEHSHDDSGLDPHYWLDFENMQKATLLIRDELIKIQPKYKKFYTQKAAEYLDMLQKLDVAYRERLKSCQLDVVIVNHNAIGYLADNYGFRVESLSGLSPEAQPSPKDLTRIFQEVEKDGVSTIFFENFVNDKAIRAVANDANVALEVFQPLGNITADEAEKRLTYENIMYTNLEKLTKALVCN